MQHAVHLWRWFMSKTMSNLSAKYKIIVKTKEVINLIHKD